MENKAEPLDRFITGNYGEDQFKGLQTCKICGNEIEDEDEEVLGYQSDGICICRDCLGELDTEVKQNGEGNSNNLRDK